MIVKIEEEEKLRRRIDLGIARLLLLICFRFFRGKVLLVIIFFKINKASDH